MYNSAVQTLQDLIAIESVANHGEDGLPYGPGPDKALSYVLDVCDSLGIHTVRKDEYAYAQIGEGDEIIGILSHLDVVPAGEGWTYPPFEGTIVSRPDGDRLYGRGSIDDKGPTVAVIYAMKEILDEMGIPGKRIRLILGQTEENGNWDDIQAYCRNEELPAYGITPDGDFPAIYCEKGTMVMLVEMPLEDSGVDSVTAGDAPNMVPGHATMVIGGSAYTGAGTPSHGCAPWSGVNAVDRMLDAAQEQINIDSVPFLRMYRDLLKGMIYGEGLGCRMEDSESGSLTVNPGLIRTEDDTVRMWLDIRYPVNADHEEIVSRIREAVCGYGASAECIYHMEPVYMDRNGKVMKELLEAYYDHTGDRSAPLAIGGATYARAMPDIIAYGPNFPGHENREHQSDEYILLDDFYKLIRIYHDALVRLLKI